MTPQYNATFMENPIGLERVKYMVLIVRNANALVVGLIY